MVVFLWHKGRDRKLRLFHCACCRTVWHMLDEPLLRRAVEVAERYADGLADDKELRAVEREIRFTWPRGLHFKSEAILGTLAQGIFPAWSVQAVEELACADAARQALDQGRTHISPNTKRSIRQSYANLLRCILGLLPYHSTTLNPAWLTPKVVSLAQAIYGERVFDRLPILADALEEAGCDNADILAHLRVPGPHARGCWVLDAILGRT